MGKYNDTDYTSEETESLIRGKAERTRTTKWYCSKAVWLLSILLIGAISLLVAFVHHDAKEFAKLTANLGMSSMSISNMGISNIGSIKVFTRPLRMKKVDLANSLHITSIAQKNTTFLDLCAPKVQCNPNEKYRSYNGSCNNFVIPTYGASVTPFLRLMDPVYADGNSDHFRAQNDGIPLPNPRQLQLELFLYREKRKTDDNNQFLMPFAQLMAHDISGIPNDVLYYPNGQVIDCCSEKVNAKLYRQCNGTIDIPKDDPVYGPHNITCMGTVRSFTSANYSCPLFPTTFINHNTHFIDASEVYGSNEKSAIALRSMRGGRLRSDLWKNSQEFCPMALKRPIQPEGVKDIGIQFDTGDVANGNQNLGITMIQNIFLRFHNFVAYKLSMLNPYWEDERLYQESRRLIIAVIQRIAYEEFLPIIIGSDYHSKYGLDEENIYDPEVNPSTSQELSSAGFRVLHTIIPEEFKLINENYTHEEPIVITDWMGKPDLLPIGNNYDKLLRGFLETPGRVAQPSYNFFISNFMFNLAYQPRYTGIDLLSIDIMRGRDVGLQPYNKMREMCGLPLASDFKDLTDVMHLKDTKKLKKLYQTVDDVDLMVGLLLEEPRDEAILGPTSSCIIADNFYRWKAGDRFFYDVKGQPGSFTTGQLKTIKKIGLGHVLCSSSSIDHVQKDVFKMADHNIFRRSKFLCSDEYKLDLSEWLEPNNRHGL
ncbi:peroxidase-like [Adelges cooleyi]|uniref:peroxidase-like n=1 Tax=Adelges cooleyi TaxID=133065 RepID=UPI0021806B81|nr:peroxidase-like [Adelges cooleyi]